MSRGMDKVRTNKSPSTGRRLALLLGVLAASSALAWVLLPPALPGVTDLLVRNPTGGSGRLPSAFFFVPPLMARRWKKADRGE